jgi:hypothetical protein
MRCYLLGTNNVVNRRGDEKYFNNHMVRKIMGDEKIGL